MNSAERQILAGDLIKTLLTLILHMDAVCSVTMMCLSLCL